MVSVGESAELLNDKVGDGTGLVTVQCALMGLL